jgi:ketosteroid isomerase-like protein
MSDGPTESIHEKIQEASDSGDIAGLISLFTDDAEVMPPNDTTVFGTEEIRDWWTDYFQWFRVKSSVLTESDLTVAGDQAFHRSSISIVVVPRKRGAQIRDDIRSLAVWRRTPDGTWKISHWLWNSIKPVGSGTTRYVSRMLQKRSAK